MDSAAASSCRRLSAMSPGRKQKVRAIWLEIFVESDDANLAGESKTSFPLWMTGADVG